MLILSYLCTSTEVGRSHLPRILTSASALWGTVYWALRTAKPTYDT